MRFLKWTVIVLLVLAGGIWVTASFALKKGAETVFAGLVEDGSVAAVPGVSFGGFPTRLDLAMTDVAFQNATTGEGWLLPVLRLHAPSWKPWHVTADLPATQTVRVAVEGVLQEITVASDGLEMSVRISPDSRAALQEVTLGGAALQAVSSLGWTLGAEDLRARFVIDPDDTTTYALTLDTRSIVPDAGLAAALAAVNMPDLPVSDLPAVIDSVTVSVQIHLTQPLDLTNAALRPQLKGLDLQEAAVLWGPLEISATGALAGDAAGFAAGRIEVNVTNWDRLPPLLAASGALQPGVIVLIGNGMRALAEEGGNPAVLTVPLVMEEGRASFGPFPLGPAPRMAKAGAG